MVHQSIVWSLSWVWNLEVVGLNGGASFMEFAVKLSSTNWEFI